MATGAKHEIALEVRGFSRCRPSLVAPPCCAALRAHTGSRPRPQASRRRSRPWSRPRSRGRSAGLGGRIGRRGRCRGASRSRRRRRAPRRPTGLCFRRRFLGWSLAPLRLLAGGAKRRPQVVEHEPLPSTPHVTAASVCSASRTMKTLPSAVAASSWVNFGPSSVRRPRPSQRSLAATANPSARSAGSVEASTFPAPSKSTAARTCEEMSVSSERASSAIATPRSTASKLCACANCSPSSSMTAEPTSRR